MSTTNPVSATQPDTPVKSSHPISFTLFDKDELPVIDIVDDDSSGRDLQLTITNKSGRDLQLAPLGAGDATAEHHHFELRFRPGVFNAQTPVTIDDVQKWSISTPPATPPATPTKGIVSLYLLRKNEDTLLAGGVISLKLQHVSANAGGGARGTRVELKYQNLQYVSGTPNPEALAAGQREQHLSIVNQRGKKNIPLHVGIVGSNKILNEPPAQNTLTLRITNLSKQTGIKLDPKTDDDNPGSQFTLSFDSSKTEEWAVATDTEVDNIHLEVITDGDKDTDDKPDTKPLHFQITPVGQGQSKLWHINPFNTRVVLGPGKFIDVTLSGIQSSLPSGSANLYLHYENIAGYWDGDFVCVIEKGPLVDKDQNVGIGTAAPISSLHIRKDAQGALGPILTLMNGSGFANAGAAIDFDGYDTDRPSNPQKPPNPPTARLQSLDDGAASSHFTFLTKKPGDEANDLIERLRISSDGNVGIGTAAPISSLHIRKDAQGALGPILTLMNGSGFANAGAAIDFDGYDTDTNPPTARLQSLDDGKDSSHFSFLTKNPGARANALIERLRISSDGNVGIGTSTPGFPLTFNDDPGDKIALWSGSGNTHGFGIQPSLLQIHTDQVVADVAFGYGSSGSFTETMRVKGNGNVGIGTVNPSDFINAEPYFKPDQSGRNVDILSASNESVLNLLSGQDADSAHIGGVYFSRTGGQLDAHRQIAAIQVRQVGTGTLAGGKLLFFTKPNGSGIGVDDARMVVDNNGYVGIGTLNPLVPLQVKGIVRSSQPYTNGWGLKSDSTSPTIADFGKAPETSNLTIKSEGGVEATGFYAVSDRRIKNIEGRSDGAADLATLSRIEITDYTFKDVVASGSRPYKKAIAQQVEKIYPQAVSQSTAVVPDIYQPAPFIDGWVELATDLKMGERVRLIADQVEGIYEVLEVAEEKFRTDFKPEGDKVFVFGREVDDFRTLDYDAISMLNVSATQQLKKEKDEEVRVLQAEITDLKFANDALQQRLALLESKFATAPGVVVAKNGSNGNGAH
jgi:hypothetical protein